MQNKTGVLRIVLLTTVCALSCAGQSQAKSVVSSAASWAWNSEPMKIVRCSSRGALCGAGMVAAYHAYYGGINGHLARVVWGGVIGGALGMVYSQLYGVQAGVRKMRKAIEALSSNVSNLTTAVHAGFQNVQGQLDRLSTQLKSCVTFEALDNVKRELLALIDFHAQHQGHETRVKIEELRQQVQGIACNQIVLNQKLDEVLRLLVAQRQQEVMVSVKN